MRSQVVFFSSISEGGEESLLRVLPADDGVEQFVLFGVFVVSRGRRRRVGMMGRGGGHRGRGALDKVVGLERVWVRRELWKYKEIDEHMIFQTIFSLEILT